MKRPQIGNRSRPETIQRRNRKSDQNESRSPVAGIRDDCRDVRILPQQKLRSAEKACQSGSHGRPGHNLFRRPVLETSSGLILVYAVPWIARCNFAIWKKPGPSCPRRATRCRTGGASCRPCPARLTPRKGALVFTSSRPARLGCPSRAV